MKTTLAQAWGEREAFFEGKTGLELGGKQGREREAVPPRLPSGWAAGLDLDRLRGVFREPDGTTARGWKDEEMILSGFCTVTPFFRQDMVAMQVLIFRRPSLLWVWRTGHGLRSFGIDELRKVLKSVLGELSETSIFAVDFKAWKGADLEFTVDAQPDHRPLLRWESASDTLRVLSDGAVK